MGEVHEFVQRKDGRWTPQVNVPDVWLHHDASGGKEGKRFVRDEAILNKVGVVRVGGGGGWRALGLVVGAEVCHMHILQRADMPQACLHPCF